ncbi:MAG: 1-deoxy-D-xylulose-5-phosphate synthase [Muribaculaceae bacterium]|nr:1-deoxy-D-xylulose-5-phosphate synthase [Muribaculaceae bacterium]
MTLNTPTNAIEKPEGGWLASIDSPADLRRLPLEALPEVCAEIRQFLIKACADNPGHFASSMGAVELTVALHYVFDTPYDRLVWDVGHQAYGHKLLTGRRDRFGENRKLGGLSGFPNPDESEYDTFTAGHASNSISAALGMAVASRMSDERRRNIVAIIGDASVSGGLAFEGINNAANTPNNLLIVLNDNDMSIDRNVGSLNSYLAHLTTSPGYNRWRYRLYKVLRRLRLVDERRRGAIMRFNNSLKSLIVSEQNIFEGLNIRYIGPFDGHDVIKIVRVLRDIRDMDGPRLLHLKTVKGKGFAPAEADPAKWHAPGKFDPVTGDRNCDKTSGTSDTLKFQDVFGTTLLELARKDPKIVGITAAMPSGTSMSVLQAEMPDRVFDVGISEGHAVTFAGGLAKEGMKPFVAIYSSFLQRAYDHIIHDVAIQRLPVTFCIDRAGLVGEDGMTHHGALDLAYLRSIPNMTVSAPSDGQMLRDLMLTASESGTPFAIRYPRGGSELPDALSEPHKLAVGKGRRVSDGTDVAVLSIGTTAADVQKAVKSAAERGISAAHYDMVFLKPIDTEILREVAASGMPVITVEDGTVNGGLGGAVAEWFASEGLDRRVIRLGIPDEFVTQGTLPQLKEICGFDAAGILDAIVKNAKPGEK